MARRLTLASFLALLMTLAVACERAPGTFMLGAFKQNVTVRLNTVERALNILEEAGTEDPARIDELRGLLRRARGRLARLDRDVQQQGFSARTELRELTLALEDEIGGGSPP